MHPYTVLGYDESTGTIQVDHVHAANGVSAFGVAAPLHPDGEYHFVVALPGHLGESDDAITFPGEGVVSQATVIEQPEVFGAPDPGDTAGARIIARFVPQAWVNDYAVGVDCEGPDKWDCTDEILAMGRERALLLEDDAFDTDHLRQSPKAPAWVRAWSGPFYVVVEDAVAEYFDGVEHGVAT